MRKDFCDGCKKERTLNDKKQTVYINLWGYQQECSLDLCENCAERLGIKEVKQGFNRYDDDSKSQLYNAVVKIIEEVREGNNEV